MSYQQELRALERNCHAILSREPLTRADLYKALGFADQAHDMAERNGFDQYKLEFYENLQNQCVDRLKTQFSQDTQCERERYAKSKGQCLFGMKLRPLSRARMWVWPVQMTSWEGSVVGKPTTSKCLRIKFR